MNKNINGLAEMILGFNSESSGVVISGKIFARLNNDATTISPHRVPKILRAMFFVTRLRTQNTNPRIVDPANRPPKRYIEDAPSPVNTAMLISSICCESSGSTESNIGDIGDVTTSCAASQPKTVNQKTIPQTHQRESPCWVWLR